MLAESDHTLVIVETITLTNHETSSSSQSITPDTVTDFSFFVSHASGVFYVSLEPWIRKLENELSIPQSEGAEFRLNRLLESANTQVEQCLRFPARDEAQDVTSCVAVDIADGNNTGYLLLTTVGNEPQAAFLDVPEDGALSEEDLAPHLMIAGPPSEKRQTYQPPKEFWENTNLLAFINQKVPARNIASLKDEVRLSPMNLNLMIEVHGILSQHTNKLRNGVAELFNNCERLRDEFKHHVIETAQCASKIDSVTGHDEAGSSDSYGSARIEERLDRIKARQEQINARYEAIRKKMVNVGGTDLSEKEAGWVEELHVMERSVDKSAPILSDNVNGTDVPAWERMENIKGLKQELGNEAEKAVREGREERMQSSVKIPSQSRKQENQYIEELLSRETALVEAAADRLRNLGISIPQQARI
jgi:nucleoporin NUP82